VLGIAGKFVSKYCGTIRQFDEDTNRWLPDRKLEPLSVNQGVRWKKNVWC